MSELSTFYVSITSPDTTLSDNEQISQLQIDWTPSDDRCRNAWANLDDATPDGAYALSTIIAIPLPT